MIRSWVNSSQIDSAKSKLFFIGQSRRLKRKVPFRAVGPRGIWHGFCSAFCLEFACWHVPSPTARCSKASLDPRLRYSTDAGTIGGAIPIGTIVSAEELPLDSP